MSRHVFASLLLVLAIFSSTLLAADRTVRIVGGTQVPDSRYPWMAAIYFRVADNRFLPGCGGSLVSDRWIVSAAHCFVTGDVPSDPNNVAFLLGATDLTSDDGVFRVVSRIVIHPEYNPNTQENDIALLELPQPVEFEPITLPSVANPVPIDGELATAAGWGATSEGGPQSNQLLEVDLPIVAHNACLPFYQHSLNQPLMLCAGGVPFGGRDSCQGDSGGPLFVTRAGQVVQAGIVSFGVGCARPGIPGIYTRMIAYTDWISGFVNDLRIYDGSGADDVVAVDNPVQVLEPNSRVADSVGEGDTDIYNTENVSNIVLETLRGDADLYVFSSANFSRNTLLCVSDEVTPIDQCVFDNAGSIFVAVSGFADSDYVLTVSSGGAEIADREIETLLLDIPVSGSLQEDTSAMYRAIAGDTATLTSVSGDADLFVFSNDQASLETLICSSEESGSAIDSCTYADPDSEVFITVLGYTDADYSLSISSATGVSNNPGGIPTSSNPEPEVTPQSPVNDADADESGGNSGGGSLHIGMFVIMLIGVARRRHLQIVQGRAISFRATA